MDTVRYTEIGWYNFKEMTAIQIIKYMEYSK